FKKNYRKHHGDARYVHQAVVKIEATVARIRKESRYVRTCRHLHADLKVVSDNLAALHGACGRHYPDFGRSSDRVRYQERAPYYEQRQTWRQPPRKRQGYQMQSDYLYQRQQAEARRRAEEAHRAAIEAQRRRIEAERRRNRGSGWSFRLF
ncbi:MAG: hypothetical protein AAF514_18075, partial [Verrucomicrobiota bacterium]